MEWSGVDIGADEIGPKAAMDIHQLFSVMLGRPQQKLQYPILAMASCASTLFKNKFINFYVGENLNASR